MSSAPHGEPYCAHGAQRSAASAEAVANCCHLMDVSISDSDSSIDLRLMNRTLSLSVVEAPRRKHRIITTTGHQSQGRKSRKEAKMFKPTAVVLCSREWVAAAALVALLSYGMPSLLAWLAPMLPPHVSELKPYADLRAFRKH